MNTQNKMKKEQYKEKQRQIESLELCLAKGEAVDEEDSVSQIEKIEEEMNSSPWKIDMDTGEIISKN